MLKRRFYVLLAPEGDGASGGGSGAGGDAGGGAGAAGAGAAGAGAAGDGAGGGANGQGGGAGAQASALAGGAGAAAGGAGGSGAAAGAAAAGQGDQAAIPDKFIVKGADGQIDHAATALKLSGSYAGLEKRFGSGDVRPDTVDGYKVNVPDALKDKVDAATLVKNDAFKAFLGSMHAAGASQKVLDVAVSEFLTGGGLAPDPAMQTATCVSTLKGVDGWKDQAGYDKHIAFAFTAAKSFAEKAGVSMDEIAKAGLDNNPTFIRIMAAIGPEIAEDRGASPEAQAQIQGNIDTLMADPAYLNANHPKHATIVAQVEALTKQQVGQRPVGAGMSHSFKS